MFASKSENPSKRQSGGKTRRSRDCVENYDDHDIIAMCARPIPRTVIVYEKKKTDIK